MLDIFAEISIEKADQLRLMINEKPKTETVHNMLRDETERNPLTRYERFKQVGKENLEALSLAAISVAGIITTIAMSFRGAVKSGARTTRKFARGLYSVGKALGPVIGGVLKIIATILSVGATGLTFLANHLWIVAIAITIYLYTMLKNRKTLISKS